MEGIIEEVERMIEVQVREFINDSRTYQEAHRKAISRSLSFKHGELGRQIDLAVLRAIEHEAMTQPTKSLLESKVITDKYGAVISSGTIGTNEIETTNLD